MGRTLRIYHSKEGDSMYKWDTSAPQNNTIIGTYGSRYKVTDRYLTSLLEDVIQAVQRDKQFTDETYEALELIGHIGKNYEGLYMAYD